MFFTLPGGRIAIVEMYLKKISRMEPSFKFSKTIVNVLFCFPESYLFFLELITDILIIVKNHIVFLFINNNLEYI